MVKSDDKIPILIITSSVGVGKTSVAFAISRILNKCGIPHAVIDLDYLREVFPRPKDDPFHSALGFRNLAAIWENFKKAGVSRLLIPNVTEDRSDVNGIRAAIPNADIQVVLLTAKIETIHDRLKSREHGESLERHLNRAVVLSENLERAGVEDYVVSTDGKTTEVIAAEILEKSSWIN